MATGPVKPSAQTDGTQDIGARYLSLAAALVGIALTFALLGLAWQAVVRNERQRFTTEVGQTTDSLATNILATHDVLDDVTTLSTVLEQIGDAKYEDFLKDALNARSGVVGLALLTAASQSPSPMFRVAHDMAAADILAQFLESTKARNLASLTPEQLAYPMPLVLESPLSFGLLQQASGDDVPGRVMLAIVTREALLNGVSMFADHDLRLFIETQDAAGRKPILEQVSASKARGPRVLTLDEEIRIPFERYSVRVSAGRSIGFWQVDKGLLITALTLGVGITLLLVALARSREQQTLELAQRNRLIESQVRLQTEELQATRDQALKASQVKSDFLASMSHEIRTPLNAIVGMAELLRDTPLTEVQSRYVKVFHHAGDALLALVNDILDFSKIEAGQLKLEHIVYEPRRVMSQVIDIYHLKAHDAGLKLLMEVADDVPELNRGDPSRLRQVLLNLVGNALKFTDRGAVTIHAQFVDRMIEFAVSDTGIGIPPDKIEDIFDSFTQGDSSTTRRFGGTGLGLTICRRLVEAMGGRIWCESRVGAGSRFILMLPAVAVSERDAVAYAAERAVAAGELRPRPSELVAAAEPQPVPEAPTAVDLPQNSGIADSRTPREILLVEDNEDNRLLIRTYLENTPYRVDEAVNGAQALSRCQRHRYRMVLMDIQMPVMDGYAATEAIRAFEKTVGASRVPIIALTANAVAEDVERSLAAGCQAHLTKPIRRKTLLDVVAHYMGA